MPKLRNEAPDFKATAVVGEEFKEIKLSDYKGKWVVLYFYPLDFTFVCPTEIRQFSDKHEEFKALNAEVLGCSTDSEHSHLAWIKGNLGPLKYPLLADTSHKISTDYEVLVDKQGIALRGTFIIDPEGILRYACVHDLDVGRDANEVLRVLNALQTGELCPASWSPGKETLGKG